MKIQAYSTCHLTTSYKHLLKQDNEIIISNFHVDNYSSIEFRLINHRSNINFNYVSYRQILSNGPNTKLAIGKFLFLKS